MSRNDGVSISVIKRLPRYYRFLGELKENGVVRISSKDLSEKMGFTASQIRQDLNCFGGFGQQGYGYNIESLYNEIGNILGVNSNRKAILIGAGNLGKAVALHMSFEQRGFNVIGVFDRNKALSGQMLRGLPIRHTDGLYDFCKDNSPTVAVLCIPSAAAKELAPQLVELGIKGFWNFSHYDISADYPQVAVENVHLSDSLMTLSYHVSNLD
ncbi:MAG: redox-sensing transcriptional repressor Rex [Clostridia bacterium]|nr:redox-sensing transcriptional repressor Rex [Oscillospiraceae bacterium]MBQ3523184.1 redox-sensing transcriptional repressor Rex [Clostridia bacterium]